VALGAGDEQPAGLADLFPLGLTLLLDAGHELRQLLLVALVVRRDSQLAQLGSRDLVGVAAELDVNATAGHVRRDRDGPDPARLGNRLTLALRVLGLRVQDYVVDALALQLIREHLRDLDRDGAHQDRLALLVPLGDLVDDRLPLAVLGLVDLVVVVVADHRDVGRDVDHRYLIDLHELLRLGQRRSGHPAELVVEAEVVLERDRRECLVLLADRDALLGLDRLVEPLGPAAALEDAAGEFVDDLHLAVDDRVVVVAKEQRLGLK
jgi:hypothetical protein